MPINRRYRMLGILAVLDPFIHLFVHIIKTKPQINGFVDIDFPLKRLSDHLSFLIKMLKVPLVVDVNVNDILYNKNEEVVVMKRISEVATMFGVTTRTIRYYEEIGLLKPSRSSAKQRLYPKSEIAKLKLIARGKRYGFTLTEIKEMVLLFDKDRTGKKQLERTIQYGEKRLNDIDERVAELLQIKREIKGLMKEFTEKLNNLEGESYDE